MQQPADAKESPVTALYAVFGNPIKHSRSPQLHQAFAKQLGESLRYETRQPPVDDFAGSFHAFVAQEHGLGGNVTVPFKEDAMQLADVVSERARQAGAVNTLVVGKDGRLYGDNTDGIGLVRDLDRQGISLEGKRVLVLGAGGAVRGILGPFLSRQPATLMIANRTAAKAQALAELFAEQGNVSGGGYEDVTGQWDVVLNGTSASLSGALPPLPADCLANGAVAYDMVYGAEPTPFMAWAREHGATISDGLGMLVEQAAEAYLLWRNKRPDTAPIHAELRAALTF